MTRALVLIALLVLASAPAGAGQRLTVEPGVGDRLVIREWPTGRRLGTVEPGVGDRLIIRPAPGTRTPPPAPAPKRGR